MVQKTRVVRMPPPIAVTTATIIKNAHWVQNGASSQVQVMLLLVKALSPWTGSDIDGVV